METDGRLIHGLYKMNAIIILLQYGSRKRVVRRGCRPYFRVHHQVIKTTSGKVKVSPDNACFDLYFSISSTLGFIDLFFIFFLFFFS